MNQAKLHEVAERAWRAFEHASALPSRVVPAIPILFFGDLNAYCSSKTRVLTVGLNPSLREFPLNSPFDRFPLAEIVTIDEPDRYLGALSAYFRTNPYKSWFNAFEQFLNGLEASYYPGQPSTALHTDICSPVATDPTWNSLDPTTRTVLEKEGGPLWHALLKVLQPQIVVLSVAQSHISRIQFKALSEWKTVHVFEQKADGTPRRQPIRVDASFYKISGERSLFIFIRAAQTPLGLLGNNQKREAGMIALEEWRYQP